MSGEILRNIGTNRGRAARVCITPASSADSAAAPCRSRSFSVFGDETLTVAKSTCGPHSASTCAKSAARSALSLLAPRFRPTIAPAGRSASRAAISWAPSLLKPKRLIAARSAASRNSRGRGLPGCGRGVAAPTSMKPKPLRDSGRRAVAFLSNPAASPTGFGRSSPASLNPQSVRHDRHCARCLTVPSWSARRAKPWAVSGSTRRSNDRPSRLDRLHQTPSGKIWPEAPSGSDLSHVHFCQPQRAVEVWEQLSAARRLPLQCFTQVPGLDRQQHQIAFIGEVL
jgi:hypothetical protein